MRLRDYQVETVAKLQEQVTGRTLVVAPTGAGKGTMAVELLVQSQHQNKRAIFMVHRREILHDVEERLKARGVRCAQSLHSDRPVRVVSVQAAMRMQLQKVDLLVVDEAHHYAAEEWGRVIEGCRPRRVVGFTATPQRADGKPLSDVFHNIIDAVSYETLLRRRIIVPCRVLRPNHELLGELAQDPVDAYLRYGRGEQAILFDRSIDEAKDDHARLQKAGIQAGLIHHQVKKVERDQTMRDLESGKLQIVVNVGVLTEGIDVPHVTCIVLARPCTHESMYIQIVGRVLRSAPGKHVATMIDLVGASHRHGLPGINRSHSFHREERDVREEQDRGDEERQWQRRPLEIIDVELEEVCAGVNGTVIYNGKRREPAKPKVPYVRPKPQHMTGGFVYVDREFWSLRWREHGAIKRMGLCTRDKDVAEQLLALFRTAGPEAVHEAVQQRRRCSLSVFFDKSVNTFKLAQWNDDRTKRIKTSLYTTDQAEAEAVLSLYREGRPRDAEVLISKYRNRPRSAFKRAPRRKSA